MVDKYDLQYYIMYKIIAFGIIYITVIIKEDENLNNNILQSYYLIW